jgi:hypothetical protein
MDRHTLFRVLAAVLAGTAISASDAATPPNSEGLIAVQSRSLDEIYVRPNANLSAYRKIIVDPGQATLKKNWLKDINSQRDMTRWLVPEDAQRVQELAASSLAPNVAEGFRQQGYEVVAAAGPGVLRVTPRVSDLYLNAPDTHNPGIQRYFVRDGGQATLQLEVRDAVSGELLGRVVDRGLAREIRLNNRATDVSNLFWFEALYREWASNSAKVFAEAQP